MAQNGSISCCIDAPILQSCAARILQAPNKEKSAHSEALGKPHSLLVSAFFLVILVAHLVSPHNAIGQTSQYRVLQITSDLTDHEWPAINNKGDIVWSQQVNGLWRVFKASGPAGTPSAITVPDANHNFRYPDISDAGNVIYLKDTSGGGSGQEVILNQGGTESLVEFSSSNSLTGAYRNAGPHFGISRNGTTITYFDFCSGSCTRTFDVSGTGQLQCGSLCNTDDFPDINDNKNIVVVDSPSGEVRRFSSANTGYKVVTHGFLSRINNNDDLVVVAAGQVFVYFGPDYSQQAFVHSGSWAAIDDFGDVVFQDSDSSGHKQIFYALPGPRGVDLSLYDNGLADTRSQPSYFWDTAQKAGTTFAVIQGFGGVSDNTYAQFVLNDARANYGMLTATYCQLNFKSTAPSGYSQVVDHCLLSTGSETGFLRFVSLAVEDDFLDDSSTPANVVHIISDAVKAVRSTKRNDGTALTPVIYTRRIFWPTLTGNSTLFSGLPLWDTSYDGLPDLMNDCSTTITAGCGPTVWVPYGGWTSRAGKQYTGSTDLFGVSPLDLDIFSPNLFANSPSSNTNQGDLISVQPVDGASGTTPVIIGFSTVQQAGSTTVVSSSAGPAVPAGFQLGTPPIYYELGTSAVFSGSVSVCINYSLSNFTNPNNLRLFHYENGAWVDQTVTVNPASNTICAKVSSLSPFAIFEQIAQIKSTTPIVTVIGGTFSYDGLAHSASATATSASGNSVSGSFVFTYTPGGSSPPVGVGIYSVTAQFTSSDPNYSNASSTGTITITSAVPVIFSIAPAAGSQGQTLANVVITGQSTHFVQGTTTCSFGAGITVNSCTVNSPTSATANITIASSATPGSQTVTVTTGSEVATLLNAFVISAPVSGKPNLVWLGGGHTGGIRSVSASPDGTIWSAGGDNTIKQWNSANMNMLRTFPLSQNGAAFASDGQHGLVIGPNGVQNVSLADGSASRTFALGDLSGAYLPTISANGQTIAYGRSNYAADVLVFANGTASETDILASGYATDGYLFGGVNALAVSADGQYVAAALSADYQTPGTIRLYRASDGSLIRTLTHNAANVSALAFSADGTILASSSTDGKLNVLRLSDLVVVSSIAVSESGTPVAGTALAFSPDGTQVAISESAAAQIFHLPDGASLGRIAGAANAVAFTPDGQWLVVGGAQDVRLWLIATLAPLPSVATHSGSITSVAYSPKGDLVASASTDFTVKLRSAVDGTLVASLTGHTDVINAVAFSPDGDMLATGSSDHTIRIWRTSDHTLLTTLIGHTQAVRTLAFSPDGSLLASGSSSPEGVVRLWSVGGAWFNTSTLTGIAGNVTSVQFSPSGQSVAGASDGGIVRVWQVGTGALAQTYLAPTQGGMSLAYSPDGQTLIAGWGQDILVFQGTQTTPINTVAAHSKSGTVVAYSPDGQRVLSGNTDGTLKLWNPTGWAQVTSYNQETDAAGAGVTSVTYSPDNTRFVYGRADATIGVVSTGSAALPATVTVTTNPPGLAISVDGTSYIGPNTFSWTRGSSHSVSVVSPQGSNGTRYVFMGWTDGGAASHAVTPVESRVYTAVFMTQELLTVQSTPNGGGTVVASPSSPDGYYAVGTMVQLTETPTAGYDFVSWSGDASGSTNSVTELMSKPHSVTATFTTAALADIAVAMSSSVSQINAGKPLAFTVTVTNLGPSPSAAMTLIANLPGAFSLVSASSSRGSCTGTVQISCPLGIIQTTDIVTATISVNVNPIATGSIAMTASVNGGTADLNPSNNSATVTVKVLPAGLPPILWMGGGVDSYATSIKTAADGTFWTTGHSELMQWRVSDLHVLQTTDPGLTMGLYASGSPTPTGAQVFSITADGKYIAYVTGTSVGVYQTADGTLVRSFSTGFPLGFVPLSDDGQTVAFLVLTGACIFGNDYNIVIGHVSDGSQTNAGNTGCAGAVTAQLSPNGAWLAISTNAHSGNVDLYRTSDGSYVRSFSGLNANPDFLMWTSDSNLLMGANPTQIKVWRISDFLEIQSLTTAPSAWYYYGAAISRDGQYVAFGNGVNGQAASVWKVSDGSLLTTIPAQYAGSSVFGLNITPDDAYLVIDNGHLTMFSLPQGTPVPNPPANVGSDAAIAYSPAGSEIATAGRDSIITVWNSSTGTTQSSVTLPNWSGNNPVTGVVFSPDGTKLVAGVDNNVTVWNTSNYSVVATLTGHTQPVAAVAFSPDGTMLASASASPEQAVKLWSTHTWTLVRTLVGASGGLRSVQFSPDGSKVIAGGDDGIAREWNVSTGTVVNSYLAPGQGSMRITYSPDGNHLAAGWTGKVLIFNSGTTTPNQTLNAHSGNNTSVAWSPDGKRLISGNQDGTVDVWDTVTWGQLSQYNAETYAQNGGVLTVAYSPDNSQFSYGRADAVLVVVDSGSSPTGTLTTVTTNPAGLNIVVDGATTASPQTFRWAAGSTHTIGAPSPQGSSTGIRNVFGNWSDSGTQTHTITTPSSTATYTAQFNPQYLLTPSASPVGGGSILLAPTSTDGYYDSGTTVQAVATANLGFVFGSWSGATTGTTNPASVVMSAPQSVTANYSVIPTDIVTTTPPGLLISVDGTQYTSPQSFNWAAGTSHTVAVGPTQGTRASRYTFINWGDGGAISHTITAPSVSTTDIANFNTQYPLATNSNPAGGGTITANPVSGDGYYNSGANVQLTATAATGYQFTGWSGDVTGTTNPQLVTMSAARSATANFALWTGPLLSIVKTHVGNFTLGQNGATYSVTVSNTGVGPTSGTVTVTETVPNGLTLASMSGLNWTCTSNVCTRSDLLVSGASYPAITVTVNVASSAPSSLINQVTVSGGGSANAVANDPTTITKAPTSTALGSSPNPSVTGQSVTFTATVSGTASGTPTGSVTFYDGTTSLGTGIPSSLVGYWPLDNGAAVDLMGGNSGLVTNTTSTTGRVGGALHFDGVTSLVTTPYAPTLDTSKMAQFSAEAWVRFSQTPPVQETFLTIVGKQQNVAGGSWSFWLGVRQHPTLNNGQPFFGWWVSSNQQFNNVETAPYANVPSDLNWHHVVGTYDGGTGTLNLYVDGALVRTWTIAPSAAVNDPNFGIQIGSLTPPGYAWHTNPFDLDEVGLWNRALGASDILNQYNAGLAGQNYLLSPTTLLQNQNGTGVATFSTSSLAIGSHSITAQYGGDANYASSTSAALAQVVQVASANPTATALASSLNPSVAGQSVTFTATVSSTASGTPTGSVTFYDGTTSLGTGALNGSGMAVFATGALAVGSHSITARYGGDTNFAASVSTAVTEVISGRLSGTMLVSSLNPSVLGQSVTFTATVTGTGGTPSGAVTFFDNGVALNALSWMQLAPSGVQPSGRYESTAAYDPTTNQMIVFGGGALGNDKNDVWALNLSGSPSWSQLSPGGTPPGARVGAKSVYDAANARMILFGGGLGNSSPCANDLWVLSNANRVGGTPTWTQLNPSGSIPSSRWETSAIYDAASNRMTIFGGNNCFSGFYNDVWVLSNANGLGGNPAWTQLTPAGIPPSPSGYHTAVYDPNSNRMIVFGVQASGNASNAVWVLTNANGLGGTPAWIQLSPAGPTIPARNNQAAVYDVQSNQMIVFGGGGQAGDLNDVWVLANANGLGGTPTWSQVNPSGGLPPAREGFPAVYDPATKKMVFFAGASGSTYYNDAWALNLNTPSTLNASGQATLSISSLALGSSTITAQYGGDASFAPSASAPLVQVVTGQPSTTALASSLNPSVAGQSVTFTATVSSTASGTPTGSVTFHDGTTSLGSGALTGGKATLATSTLAVGSHSITAQYGGDANFTGSTSSLALTQVVNGKPSATALVSSLNPEVVGQSVTFTATVTSTAGGTPTGSVTFLDGTASLGTGVLNSTGVATFSTSSLAIGSHSITAQYGGDANFSGSTSSPALTQVVNSKPSATALVSSLNPEVAGQSVTFTATVTSTAGGTPTGTVTFFNGSSALGTGAVTLNGSGVATLSTTVLAVGSPSITASYSGDANYAASSSSAVTETVNVAGFAPAPTGLAVTAGQNLPINLTLYSAAGSGLNFTLNCLGAPAKTTCSFGQNPVAPAAPPNGTTVQLTLGTSSSELPASPSNRAPWPWGIFGISATLATLLAAGMIQSRHAPRRRLAFGMSLAVFALASVLTSCGGAGSTYSPPPTYTGTPKGPATFTVSATSGTTTVSTQVTITVQ